MTGAETGLTASIDGGDLNEMECSAERENVTSGDTGALAQSSRSLLRPLRGEMHSSSSPIATLEYDVTVQYLIDTIFWAAAPIAASKTECEYYVGAGASRSAMSWRRVLECCGSIGDAAVGDD